MFGKVLEIIDTTLVQSYGLPKPDAEQLERELFEWFERVARRPGSPESVRALQPHLIAMACKVGHVYCVGKFAEEQPHDEKIRRALALGPEVIALEIENRLSSRNGKGESP